MYSEIIVPTLSGVISQTSACILGTTFYIWASSITLLGDMEVERFILKTKSSRSFMWCLAATLILLSYVVGNSSKVNTLASLSIILVWVCVEDMFIRIVKGSK